MPVVFHSSSSSVSPPPPFLFSISLFPFLLLSCSFKVPAHLTSSWKISAAAVAFLARLARTRHVAMICFARGITMYTVPRHAQRRFCESRRDDFSRARHRRRPVFPKPLIARAWRESAMESLPDGRRIRRFEKLSWSVEHHEGNTTSDSENYALHRKKNRAFMDTRFAFYPRRFTLSTAVDRITCAASGVSKLHSDTALLIKKPANPGSCDGRST